MKKKINIDNFFSTENFSEIKVTQAEAEKLSNSLKFFYKDNFQILKKAFEKKFNYKFQEILINRAIMPLTYIFFERLLRAYKFNKKKKDLFRLDENFYEFEKNSNIEDFSAKSSFSNDFNLSLISNFLKILKNENTSKVKFIICRNDYLHNEKNFKNFLQNYYPFNKKIHIKFNSYLEKFFNLFNFYKKIPIIHSANADPAFSLKGFYLNYFSRIKSLKLISHKKFSFEERRELIKILKENNLNLEIFFNELKLSKNIKHKISEYYFEFIKLNYPICFFENLESNFNYIKNILKKFIQKKIFSSDDESSIATLAYFVSKNLNFKIFKFQHSGHYGYLRDTLEIDQIEVKNTDTFISNGWTENLKKYDEKENVEFVKLPSPFISEKKKYFQSYKLSNNKKYDFVFLPQFVKPFTNPIQGIANFRRDIIDEYVSEFWELAECFHRNNFKATLKFYNRFSKSFIQNNLDLIDREYSNTFFYQDNYNKGLSIELVNNGNMILLDQPGTAFLECLNYDIPIMVYWKKSFCEPSFKAIKFFDELNKVGIIHYDTKSLINFYERFLNNPNEWLKDIKRKDAINLFCDNYAITKSNWSQVWKKLIFKLNEN